MEHATADLEPSAVVLTTVAPIRLRAVERELAVLAARTRVALGGLGAESELAERVGAVLLTGDPVTAANQLVCSIPL